MTTRGLWHIQVQENAIHEQIQLGLITPVEHIGSKHNLTDAFTKEEKNKEQFITCRNLLVTKIPTLDKTSHKHEKNINTEFSASDQQPITDTNDQNENTAIVLYNTVMRDIVDVMDSASSMCLLHRARGVLSYICHMVGHTL
jgi:hypothetical protein